MSCGPTQACTFSAAMMGQPSPTERSAVHCSFHLPHTLLVSHNSHPHLPLLSLHLLRRYPVDKIVC